MTQTNYIARYPHLKTLLIRGLDGTVADYYPESLPADGEAFQGGRRFGNRVEWARTGGHVAVETTGIMVIQMDVTRTFDEATCLLPVLRGRVGR